ncbi:hypothetical protein JCM10212_005316 [Sporobolomyces blumeae]
MLGNALARSVIDKYSALPANGKPRPRSNGTPEWTVLAGFCLFRTVNDDDDDPTDVECVALGTGLKALPHQRLPVHGDVLHDSHAEVVARRGFKLWIYRQIELASDRDRESSLFERDEPNHEWTLKPGWNVALWVSTLPCGDASTYSLSISSSPSPGDPFSTTALASALPSSSSGYAHTASTRSALHPSLIEAASLGLTTDRTPLASSPTPSPRPTPGSSSEDALVRRGRNSYTSFSTLRTKPGRADSPPTTSHSCSDKIAIWNLCGCQGALLASLDVRPIPLDIVVVGGIDPSDPEVERVRGEVRRAVGGRLEGWNGPSGTRVNVPRVEFSTEPTFCNGRDAVASTFGIDEGDVQSCQESLSWVQGIGTEVISNGIRQGASSKRKPGEPLPLKSRSRLCKLSLFQREREVRQALEAALEPPSSIAPRPLTYFAVKHAHEATSSDEAASTLARYQCLKQAVREGPFRGWLVSGRRWESFVVDGTATSPDST